MTLLAGDLTTPLRVTNVMPSPPPLPSQKLSQIITSMSALIYNKLNRSRLYSQNFSRTFDGVGTMQLVLPDWPVTMISTLQLGGRLIKAYPLPNPTTGVTLGSGWGYRFVPWAGDLPGSPAVIEFVNGFFYLGAQNIQVNYTAGYAISNEPWTIPASGPYTVTVLQQQGIWCRNGGVVYATTGVALTPVSVITAPGQYIPPLDTNPGLYTFGSADAGNGVLISYSFIPADLEEACIQMVMERISYYGRIGVLSQALGGQETMSFLRGGGRYSTMELPPEVEALLLPYVSVIPPAIGAPV